MLHPGFEAQLVTQTVSARLDVFLSYKREERDVAEALASYLTTKGYDVWWDAALLAGEDFVKVVHAELVEAKAVVVLWSKQARSSHWVRAEAALALANGTLINAVIDGMAFEGIPPEFSSIQAVRLGDDPAAFHAEIAAAIARKGTAPSQAGRTEQEATTTLADKVRDADFFRIIADSTDPEDYREYLERFGEAGQFAGLARRRIASHERSRAAERGLWAVLREHGRIVGGVLSGGAALVAILVFLGIQPGRDAVPSGTPVDAVAGAPDKALVEPMPAVETGTTAVVEPEITVGGTLGEAFRRQVTVTTTLADGTQLAAATGEIKWDGIIRIADIPTLIGTIDFASSGSARLILSNDGRGAKVQIDAMPLVPALQGFDRIASVQGLSGTPDFMSFTIDPDTPLETLKSISYKPQLDLDLAGPDGRTGVMQVATGGAGWSILQAALTGTGP